MIHGGEIVDCHILCCGFLHKKPHRDANAWVLDSTCQVLYLNVLFRIAILARILKCFLGSTLIKKVHKNVAEVHSRETVVVFGDAEEGEVVIK